MKNSYLLSGIISFSAIVSINASEANRAAMKSRKYNMIDQFIHEYMGEDEEQTHWPYIFSILNSTDYLNVNEYRTKNYGSPLLLVAIDSKNPMILKRLIEDYKANPNLGDTKGNITPLMFACGINELAMVELLLQYGANPYQKDKNGNDSFYYAKNNSVISKALAASKFQR